MANEKRGGSGTAENILLGNGEHADCEEAACMRLLEVDQPEAVDVLFVTFTKSARERLDAWKRHADQPPANIGIVSVQVGGSNGGDRDTGAAVRRISDPSDLTGVGIAISEFLSQWSENDNQTVVCFQSLTALLQYVDANRVFQFCNEITSKFEQAGAQAHFHITPGAHEEQVLSVLSSLFDDKLRASEVGDDDSSSDAPENAGTIDPFEYAAGNSDPSGDDVVTTDTDENVFLSRTEATDETSDPADVVSAVMNDETADEDSEIDETPPPADTADDETPSESTPSSPGTSDRDGDEEPIASSASEDDDHQQDDREDLRRRLQYIGPNAAATSGDDSDDESRDEADTRWASRAQSNAGSDNHAFYHRTTATVIGVVVMLVLISVLAAAVPFPMGDPGDAPDDVEPDVEATPDVDETASGGANDSTETETPTATPTATPSPTEIEISSSSSGGSSSDSTPTETQSGSAPEESNGDDGDDGGDSVTDVVNDDNDVTDTVEDTVDETTDTVNDTLSGESDDSDITDTVDETTDTVDDTLSGTLDGDGGDGLL